MQSKVIYNLDVFFKYVFGRKTKVSTVLRDFLLKKLLDIDIDDLSVDNPELIPHYIEDKDVILDIYMNKGMLEIDIEMQKSSLSKYLYNRFQYYGARMISYQLESGDSYDNLKKVYQIIFVEDQDEDNPKLMESYHLKQEIGNKVYPHYIHTTLYVYLPYIEVIAKEKAVLSEIEAMLYLIHKGTLTDIKYEKKEGVIEMIEMVYSEFMGNERLVKATMKRFQQKENFQVWHDMDVEEARVKGAQVGKDEGIVIGKQEGIVIGKQEGIVIGKQEGILVGKQEVLMNLLKQKYPDENHEWIKEVSENVIARITKYLLIEISYDKLKELIQSESIQEENSNERELSSMA